MKRSLNHLPLLIVVAMLLPASLLAQNGLLNDDFSLGNTNNWAAATANASSTITNGELVVTTALQTSGKYRGDLRKTGSTVFHAGQYPIVAVKMNKPPRCSFFFDTSLGSYNSTNNNHTVIQTPTGNIYYWNLGAGKLGTTTLSLTTTTTVTNLQFKVADIVLTQQEVTAGDTRYEVQWVKTFASVEALRTAAGITDPAPYVFTGTFVHPGLLHSTEDLARINDYVARQWGRPYASYQLLSASAKASSSYTMAGPYVSLTRDNTVTVNGVPGGTVKNGVEADFLAAYYNALMWKITGNTAHAQKAVQIIDAYASTTTAIVGGDSELNGLYGFMLANAAEIMRTYSAWPQNNIQECKVMLQSVFYPVIGKFKPCSHGNWDIICMKALMAIAIFTDDKPMLSKAVNYFYHGEGNGSIDNYVLTAAGQLQESNRDQPHSMLALGSLAELAEMALKQGIDLYEASNNAILRGYEYTAKYNLGNTVPYQTSYDFCERNFQDYTPEAISTNGRGQFRAVFEIAYNHYAYRRDLDMPYTREVIENMGPEGAPFGADNPGYGSLLFYLSEAQDHDFNPSDAGLIDHNFTSDADGWIAVTSNSTATLQSGGITITLVAQTNGKGRGDIRRSTGATLYPPNYPILAIKFNKPATGNVTFDTNLGSYGNGANHWTGKVGDDIYYYNLTTTGFGAGATMLSGSVPTALPTFQFKVADITSGETSYTVDWVKTVKTVAELQALLPAAAQPEQQVENKTDEIEAVAVILSTTETPAQGALYPNPVSDKLYLRLNETPHAGASLALYNSRGTQVLSYPLTQTEQSISLLYLPAGIYLLRVTNGKSFNTHKVIKN